MTTIFHSQLSGAVRVPPSKSELHHKLILSALVERPSVIMEPLLSAGTLVTLDEFANLVHWPMLSERGMWKILEKKKYLKRQQKNGYYSNRRK